MPVEPLPTPTAPKAGAIWEQARLHLSRAWACDFTRMEATTEERAILVASPRTIRSKPLQDYLAWRRSMAWVALVPACLAALFGFIGWASSLEDNPGGVNFLSFVSWAGRAGLIVGLLLLIREWPRPRRTRRYLRYGWLLALLLPVAIAMVPMAPMYAAEFERQDLAQGGQGFTQEGREAWTGLIGIVAGLAAFWQTVPALLSIFPGMARSGLILKTLLPGRATGAILTIATGPAYALLFLVIFTQFLQVTSSALISVGTLLLVAAPLLVARSARALLPPATPEDVGPRVARVKSAGRLVLGAGALLVVIGLFTSKVLGKPFVGFGDSWFSLWTALELVVGFLAMFTAYTVVSVDGVIEATAAADRNAKLEAESPQRTKDERSLAELESLFLPPPGEGPKPS
jgi:hypothetical protein